jgi:DNA-binding NarL/FixJ family response regulator
VSDADPAAAVPDNAPHVLVLEDNANLRETYGLFLRHFLSAGSVDLCDTLDAALDVLDGATPDIILTDLSLPSVSGVESVQRFVETAPGVPVLVISGSSTAQQVRDALNAGAAGYVLKGKRSEIIEGVEAVLRGEQYLSDELNV